MANTAPYFYKASKKTFERARKLRRDSTPAEKLLWRVLRSRNIEGYKFRRQHAIAGYVVDFYCSSGNLAIEIDGDIHELDQIKVYDKEREGKIKNMGVTVMRFKNEDVFGNLEEVINKIISHLQTTPSP
ncbi:MAG: endonuclease domain-containing protein [Bacteroidetes bacterium]|nr:MAG: endonuclease domain-containing protein [Bacteroidota bacterium]